MTYVVREGHRPNLVIRCHHHIMRYSPPKLMTCTYLNAFISAFLYNGPRTRVGHGFGVLESTLADSAFFSDADSESKVCEKPDLDLESHVIFGSRSLHSAWSLYMSFLYTFGTGV